MPNHTDTELQKKIVLVDDHAVVREGLAALIRLLPHCAIEAQVATIDGAKNLLRSSCPDLIICDFFLPDGTALDLLDFLHDISHPSPTMILSISSNAENVFNALQKGATAYELKSAEPSELLMAVETVLQGRTWIGSGIKYERQPVQAMSLLTSKEVAVLGLAARGISNEAIALQMNISINTAKAHMYHIMKKLASNNRTEAVAKARALGLIA